MAHDNIEIRHDKVKAMLALGCSKKEIKKVCSNEFGCSPSAIYNDLLYMKHGHRLLYVRKEQRKRIKEIDKHTCQYCGLVNVDDKVRFIVEHIVPQQLGGPAVGYNLVYACQKCNLRKRTNVWIPTNILEITIGVNYWKHVIEKLSKK